MKKWRKDGQPATVDMTRGGGNSLDVEKERWGEMSTDDKVVNMAYKSRNKERTRTVEDKERERME